MTTQERKIASTRGKERRYGFYSLTILSRVRNGCHHDRRVHDTTNLTQASDQSLSRIPYPSWLPGHPAHDGESVQGWTNGPYNMPWNSVTNLTFHSSNFSSLQILPTVQQVSCGPTFCPAFLNYAGQEVWKYAGTGTSGKLVYNTKLLPLYHHHSRNNNSTTLKKKRPGRYRASQPVSFTRASPFR